jgi:glycosyltransferase involved in cell wall biosynthesis
MMCDGERKRGCSAVTYHVGFLLDQAAGGVTTSRNLRGVIDSDPEIDPTWCEISYYRPEGAIERLRERWFSFVPTYLTGNARAVLELRRSLRGRSYDAIFSNARLGSLFARTFARTPTMIDFDATPKQIDRMAAYTTKRDPWPVAEFKWRLCRDMLHSAQLLQAFSRWAKYSAIEDYGVPEEKIVVNPPGVPLSFWRPPAESRTATVPMRVLFVGGDFGRKGGAILLEWYRTQRPDEVELHIVTREPVESGPGITVYRDIEPNSDRLLTLYQQADVFVLPSLGECFGIATIEAMATGLPVIASAVGGTADIIDHGANGFILRAGDVAELTSAIATLQHDEARRRSMGQRSRELAEERFELERNTRLTVSYLKDLAARGREHKALQPAPS